MKVFGKLEPQQRQNLLVLFTAGILFWSSMASLLPTLPGYVADLGGSKQQIGIVMGAFAIGLLVFRPWLGKLADRRSRKLVLIIGTTVAAIAPLGYLGFKSIPLLMLIRAFHGISIAAFTTAYSTLIVELSPVKHRGELIGYMSLTMPVGLAIGPAIGGFLVEYRGYTPLFILSASLGAIATLACSRIAECSPEVIADNVHKHATSRIPTLTLLGKILRDRALAIPTIVLLLYGLSFGAVSTFVPLFIEETQIDLNPGLFYTAAAIASFSIRLFVGKASDRYGRGVFISSSLVFYGLAMAILSQATDATATIIAAILEGGGSGILVPMMIALLSDRSSSAQRGQIFAICISGLDLGIAIAGPYLGTVAESLGYKGIFGVSAGVTFLGLAIFAILCNKTVENSFGFAIGKSEDAYAIEQL
ncbi:MFS transporter [Merismopedia glauca]|uniref:MFS transporter n=1 Tax=Merismopedia glauca CCAP 1448/3 TaxID=1296344 RepID=A0A2T1BXT9_9CYAN|nr:MFS transporter [Merismopedia glauca]PSB00768.1 MFS transporter [Merismopedia glauca CCAP 1448/3]